MKRRCALLALFTTVALVGCSDGVSRDPTGGASTGRVLGGPSREEVFAPFQGTWQFESRTWDPPLEGNRIASGPDLTFDGHIIKIAAGPSCMRLCQVRKIDGGIECEAWREEDINDPGDMQRAQCTLRLIDGKLHFHWRVVDTDDYSNDPIIAAADFVPPPRAPDPSAPWWLEVYVKKTAP